MSSEFVSEIVMKQDKKWISCKKKSYFWRKTSWNNCNECIVEDCTCKLQFDFEDERRENVLYFSVSQKYYPLNCSSTLKMRYIVPFPRNITRYIALTPWKYYLTIFFFPQQLFSLMSESGITNDTHYSLIILRFSKISFIKIHITIN